MRRDDDGTGETRPDDVATVSGNARAKLDSRGGDPAWIQRLRSLAWLPIPLLVTVIAALWVADLRTAWSPPFVIWLVHYGPVVLGVTFIVIPAARVFLANGQPSLLMLGCGVLMMDVGVITMPVAFARSSDTAFAIYNTSALLAALCHFTGVAMTSRRTIRPRRSAMWLTAAYAGGTAVMGLVIWLAFTDRMPAFFIEDQGGTLLRSLVVSAAVSLFLLTAGLLWQASRRESSPFLFWYSLGLVLMAAGLTGSMLIVVRDSLLQWVARLTQVFGTIYMCIAVLASWREKGVKRIPMEAVGETWRESDFLARLGQQTLQGWVLRYGMAAVAVAVGFGMRLALTAWVGPGLPIFITFYPAVMVAALIGGFGPGLTAMLLAGVTAAFWVLPPVGQFAIASPADRLGLVVFAGMGLFMSVVAHLYRRDRDKAAAYDREMTLRESQEALRRQAELIDPVRAEIIAREMQRVVRERGRASAVQLEPTGEALRRVPAVAGTLVAGVGLLVLIGWTLGIEPLKSVIPGLARMKANTALCFLLAGVALALRERRTVRLAFAGFVCAVAGLTLAEYITGGNSGLDQLLFRDRLDPHTIFPGRMVEATALGFLLGGASLLLLKARAQAALWAQQAMSVGVTLIGGVALLGYAYDVQPFYRFDGYSSMALHTAASLVLLAVGLLFARNDGLGAVLMIPGPGAALMRRLLPTALLVPVIVGWLRVHGSQAGLFQPNLGTGLYAISMMLTFSAAAWWTARILNRTDTARRETETQLRNQAELMDHAHEALIVREPGGVIRAWNRGAEALYGWNAAEAVGQRTHILLRTKGVDVVDMDAQLESTGRWEGELVHTTRDGRCVTVESRQTASRIGDGQVFILESNRDITERRRLELQLHRNLREHRTILDSVPAMVFYKDQENRFVRTNTAFEMAMGRPKEALEGKSLFEIYPREQADAYWRDDKEVMASGEPKTGIVESMPTAFGMRLLQTDKMPYVDESGNVIGVIGFAVDITDRKNAEEKNQSLLKAVQEEKDRLSALVNSITDEVWFANTNKEFSLANPSALREFGFDSVDGIDVEKFAASLEVYRLDGSPRPVEEAPPLRALRGEVITNVEEKVRTHEGGELRYRQVSSAPVRDTAGNVIGSVSVVRDITEIKRAEQAFRESEERFRLAAQCSNDFIYERDIRTGQAQFFGDIDGCLGYAPGAFPRTLAGWIEHVHPEDLLRVMEAIQARSQQGEPYDIEYRIRRSDGTYAEWSDCGVMLRDDAGNPVKNIGAASDVTERKQAEEDMKRLVDNLARSNRDLQQFAYVASHDLQEPLRQVAAFTQLLETKYRPQLDETASEYIDFVVEGAKRMQSLVQGLLEYSRVDSAGKKLVPVSVREVLVQALRNLKIAIEESGANVTWDELPELNADPTQIAQVFQNLIWNAIKFRSEAPPVIHVGAARRLDEWEFGVRDNGIGFDPQFADKIFQLFQRLHTRQQYAGTGIGLTICKRVIERHGGTIWAESEPGKGATFHFTLPAARQSI